MVSCGIFNPPNYLSPSSWIIQYVIIVYSQPELNEIVKGSWLQTMEAWKQNKDRPSPRNSTEVMIKQQEVNAAILEMLRAADHRALAKADQIASLQDDLDRANARIQQLTVLLQSHNIELPDE